MLRNRGGGLPSHGGLGYDSGAGGGLGGGSYGGYGGGNGYGGGGYGGDEKYKRKRGPSILQNLTPLQITCIVLGFWAFIMTWKSWSRAGQLKTIYKKAGNSKSVKNVLAFMDSERRRAELSRREAKDAVRDNNEKLQSKISTLNEKVRNLQKSNDELRMKHEGPKKKEQEERMALRETAYQDQVELLLKATRKESKRSVLDKYVWFIHWKKKRILFAHFFCFCNVISNNIGLVRDRTRYNLHSLHPI